MWSFDADIKEAKERYEESLRTFPNVRSVGLGHRVTDGEDTGESAIVVGVTEKVPESDLVDNEIIPDTVGQGVPVDVQEIGEPEALVLEDPLLDREGRHRPVPQGVSVAHPDVTAGTVGWYYETGDGTQLLGSNNHVIADINSGEPGDPILQPGPADGGSQGDQVGKLDFYVPIEDGVNVDLATATVSVGLDNTLAEIDAPIVGVVDSLSVGDTLTKSGRTTGVTTGTIQQVDASVSVNYGDFGVITVTGCIVTGEMGGPGDSGSPAAVEQDDGLYAAGRLFAGSSTSTIFNHIHNEIDHLTQEYGDISLQTEDGGEPQPPTVEVTLTLDLGRGGDEEGNIEATVDAAAGGGVEGATVEISGETSESGTTNANGFVRFEGVPTGSYEVTATKDDASDSTTISEDDWPSQ